MTTYHFRQRMPRKGGNSFYRDKADYSAYAKTFCGAVLTEFDADWKSRSLQWTNRDGVVMVPCEQCIALRQETR